MIKKFDKKDEEAGKKGAWYQYLEREEGGGLCGPGASDFPEAGSRVGSPAVHVIDT